MRKKAIFGALLLILLIFVDLFVAAVPPTKKKMPATKPKATKTTPKPNVKPDYRFTTGFYYPIDPTASLSFPYADSELWFNFRDKNSVVTIKGPRGQTWKSIKQFVKIPATSIRPGVYNVEFLINNSVSKKVTRIVRFFGCNYSYAYGLLTDDSIHYDGIRPCHKKVANNESIAPGEGVCVSDTSGRRAPIREMLSVDNCRKYPLINLGRTKRRICLSDGTAVKTMCEAYLLYNMTNRAIIETMNSTVCTPYRNMNLSFGWNFYDCDKTSDVPIFYDAYYEPHLDGPLKICIYCGTQWKNFKFSIQFFPRPKGYTRKEIECNVSSDQFFSVLHTLTRSTVVLIRGINKDNKVDFRLRTVFVSSDRSKDSSKEPAPKLLAKPPCNPSKRMKTTSLKCVWKDTIAGQYPPARVDVQYISSNGTILQNTDELLEVYHPGSYMCQVKVYPSVCPIYDDVARTNHAFQNSNVLTMTSVCVENLGKSRPRSLSSSATTSTSFILVIVFSCVIIATAAIVTAFYATRRAIQKNRMSWLTSNSTDEEFNKKLSRAIVPKSRSTTKSSESSKDPKSKSTPKKIIKSPAK